MQQTAQREIGATDAQYAALQDCSITRLQHYKIAALQPATLQHSRLQH
jgi:hypothetical protein